MPGFELFCEEEKKHVNDVLESGVLMRYNFDATRNGHWKAKELEKALQDKLGIKYTHLTSSGTTALNTAMAALGIGAGDEIIMPSFTFVASFEAILMAGATPIIVDIDDTLTLDINSVKSAITEKTKAIMPVHMCGGMADMEALQKICNQHNLFLLEDACQAIGGSYKEKMLGTIGDAGCFSFDYVKTITCGEGGAVLTNNEDLYRKADAYTDHGHDHIGNDRGAENHPFMGYNFRISELHAAVGLAQLGKLDDIIYTQRNYKNILKQALQSISEVSFRRLPDETGDNAGFLSFFMPTAKLSNSVVKAFQKYNIDAYWNYYENNWHYIRKWQHLINQKNLFAFSKDLQKSLKYLKNKIFTQSDDFISRNISCLIKLSWTKEQVEQRAEQMVRAIKSIL